MLSDAVNGGYPTDMIDKKNQIIENVKVKFLKFCRILNEILFLTKVAFNFSL